MINTLHWAIYLSDKYFKLSTAKKHQPVEPKEFQRRIKSKLIDKLKPHQFDVTYDGLTVKVELKPRKNKNESEVNSMIMEQLSEFASANGWFVRWSDLSMMLLSPNYGEPLSPLPPKLYHITPAHLVSQIMSQGLIPRTPSYGTRLSYPPRIHVYTKYPTNSTPFSQIYNERRKDPYGDKFRNTVVLTIDTSKLRPNTKFYKDEMLDVEDAFWTYTHIPPEAIVTPSKEDHHLYTTDLERYDPEDEYLDPSDKEYIDKMFHQIDKHEGKLV